MIPIGVNTPPLNKVPSRDTRITACGIINAMINAGIPPAEWARHGIHAINVVSYMSRRAEGLSVTKEPEWKENNSNG